MSVENLTVYDSWDMRHPSIPPRSRLFSLKPIGIATSQVESLTSYVSRLALNHAVSTGILLEKELQPLINKKYGVANLHKISHYSKALNGIGTMAEDLVQALSVLTSRQDLSLLTLLPWSNLFSARHLISSTRSWCPLCIREQLNAKMIFYEPLLWSFKIVHICPQHQIPLISHCPECGKENLPLTGHSQPGCCSKCGEWLGNQDKVNQTLQQCSFTNLEWELWKAANIGDLLQKSSSGFDFDSKQVIAQALNICVSHVAQDNIALWARQLEIPRNTLWLWCNGHSLPTLQALLKVCYCLKVSVWDFLHHKFDFSASTSIPPKLNLAVRSFSKPIVVSELETSLKDILGDNQEPPLSMEEVARQLGYDRRTIFRHFPELCRLISARYVKYQKQTYLTRLNDCCCEVKQAVIKLHAQGEYPSETKVSQLITRPGFFRYKQVRKTLQDARRNLGIEP